MLHLHSAYIGSPSTGLQLLNLQNESLLLYPSADSVVVLNAYSLALVRVLPYFEAFPGTAHSRERVGCLSVDSGMNLIIAAMGSRVAVWSLSGVEQYTWRVHSSLVLPDSSTVTALDSKSGLLAVGSEKSLSVYTLVLENDLPTWSIKWIISIPCPFRALFSPSLTYIVTVSRKDNFVRLLSTTSGRQIQKLPHPRPITDLFWRYCASSSRDDNVLYTTTSDSTLRIFLPVLDAPSFLQLHASVDLFSSLPIPDAIADSSYSRVFELSKEALLKAIDTVKLEKGEQEDVQLRRLREIREESWDLFLRVLRDGSMVITALTNIERRPPTLLRHFTLRQSPSKTFSSVPLNIYFVFPGSHQSLKQGSGLLRKSSTSPPLDSNMTPPFLRLITTPPLTSYDVSLTALLDPNPQSGSGLVPKFTSQASYHEDLRGLEDEIFGFARTPEGHGVAVLRRSGVGEVWGVRTSTEDEINHTWLSKWGTWRGAVADSVVVFDEGRSFATYASGTLNLFTLKPGHSALEPEFAERSIDIPIVNTLFSLPSRGGTGEAIVGVTPDFRIVYIRVLSTNSAAPIQSERTSRTTTGLVPVAINELPLSGPSPLLMILPVDPMAWSKHAWGDHDVLLSVTSDGELAFWGVSEPKHDQGRSEGNIWVCKGTVRTGKAGIIRARCSSAKKSALVVKSNGGEELSIWDSKESEFASGLEYTTLFRESINDLDWTSTPDSQSILAIGFLHHVDLLCQQRTTYFDTEQGWQMCHKIDIGSTIPYPIGDSIWLANGALLVGAGHQMLLFGQVPVSLTETPTYRSLFEHVALQNGPLADYHPQMLLQCLICGKVELTKEIICNLASDVRERDDHSSEIGHYRKPWSRIPIERFLEKDTRQISKASDIRTTRNLAFFDSAPHNQNGEDSGFSRSMVEALVQALEDKPLPNLTPNEQDYLLGLIQTTLEIDEQRRALDANGLRYLISMRSFYILNCRADSPGSSVPGGDGASSLKQGVSHRDRLRYRDIVWAFHSESQGLLLAAGTSACNGKMTWGDARSLGVFLWLNSIDQIKSQMEVVARNEYMAGDQRDPTACSLFYFALHKSKLVHGLWRTAAWHKEQNAMLKFLGNDFSDPRWRTAALKNAFALLGKQRFTYAAAFFLLGDSLKDAVNVILKQLGDFQLAIAIARVVEQSNDGPVYRQILNDTVIPLAIKEGNRYLGSWALWILHRRDLAVRILLTPLQDIASILCPDVKDIGEPNYDDPSLALLFSQLRSKTLQAAKGTSEISGRTEFNFVLQMARVYRRMGCHALALDLVCSWSFERPAHEAHRSEDTVPSPTSPRANVFSFPRHIRRRSSIFIDMDVPSEPPTRRASPTREIPPPIKEEDPVKDEQDLFARKAGLGSLMKSARQDVQVAEFDPNSFGF